MSCPDSNCYDSPCGGSNPLYEDCGCLNPSTFECITKPGTYPDLGITSDMNGLQVLALINQRVRYPFVKVTAAQRGAITVSASNVGLHVYQTDGGADEGVWVYKSGGWAKAY